MATNNSSKVEVWREWKTAPWERFVYRMVLSGESTGNKYEREATLYGMYDTIGEAQEAIDKAE